MNVRFLTSLDVRKLPGADWQLLAPFVADVDGDALRVPAGTITDFASVPRLPMVFLIVGNIGHRAATLHDYLYRTGAAPRARADEIFRAALDAEGVSLLRRVSMYAAVRAAGASAYQGTVQ